VVSVFEVLPQKFADRLAARLVGRLCGLTAVFIPNSPHQFSGSVFFVASDKVRLLNVPLRSALGCLEQLGAKGGSFLADLTLIAPIDSSGRVRLLDVGR
jgi:hypothetical protein